MNEAQSREAAEASSKRCRATTLRCPIPHRERLLVRDGQSTGVSGFQGFRVCRVGGLKDSVTQGRGGHRPLFLLYFVLLL